ncbi:unnamed protein product, partial [Cyprideis torosa]
IHLAKTELKIDFGGGIKTDESLKVVLSSGAHQVNSYKQKGLKYVTITDIGRDGMLSGPNFELYKKVMDAHPELEVIVSGGISGMADIEQLEPMQPYGLEKVIEKRLRDKDYKKKSYIKRLSEKGSHKIAQ